MRDLEKKSERKWSLKKSTTTQGRTTQSVTPFQLGPFDLTWPAFSHLGCACLHQESNERSEQQEDGRKSMKTDKQKMKEEWSVRENEAGTKTEPPSAIMSCVILTLHPNVSLRAWESATKQPHAAYGAAAHMNSLTHTNTATCVPKCRNKDNIPVVPEFTNYEMIYSHTLCCRSVS